MLLTTLNILANTLGILSSATVITVELLKIKDNRTKTVLISLFENELISIQQRVLLKNYEFFRSQKVLVKLGCQLVFAQTILNYPIMLICLVVLNISSTVVILALAFGEAFSYNPFFNFIGFAVLLMNWLFISMTRSKMILDFEDNKIIIFSSYGKPEIYETINSIALNDFIYGIELKPSGFKYKFEIDYSGPNCNESDFKWRMNNDEAKIWGKILNELVKGISITDNKPNLQTEKNNK